MRKTRLIILPARCLAMIGYLLLYLACPTLAEMSRAQPDRELASSFQLEMLEHCASPPEDPGEGGCADSRNALAMMTRTVPPDNEHDNTCSTTDVLLLENTCTVDQRPAENVRGHSRQAKRYANASPRRLLAARSTDPSAAVIKIQAPRRQIKYRSLKRREVPDEELAVTSQRQGITTTRTLLSEQSADRVASERTDAIRRALSMERDVPKRTAKKPLSRRISELEASRRILPVRQYPSRAAPDSRALTERDISRRQSKERHASRRTTMERGMFQMDGSRRFTFERQPFHKFSADRRVSESDASTRMSTERKSSLRTSTDHRVYEPDAARRSSVVRQSERRMSTERRISEPAASRLSEKRESLRRLLTDHRMLEYSPSRRMSSERQSSRTLASDRISEIRTGSMASSERSFSGTRFSRSPTSGNRRDDSRKPRLGIRTLSEETQVSRVSTERLYPERRSSSRGVQPEERRHYAEKSFSRRNSLDEPRRSEKQHLKSSLSEARTDSERINDIRRITRNINSHISSDRRDSRTFPSTGIAIRSSSTGRGSDESRNVRISHERLFRLTSPVRHLSLSSEQKKNQMQSSESVSRISAGRRNIRISNDRLSSKISSDPIGTSRISDERRSTVSSNKFPPSRNSINRVDIYRIADNRRISATSNERISSPRISATRRTSEERRSLILHHEMALSHLSRRHVPLEERRNMKLNREKRSLSSEWFSRRASVRKTEERRFSSDRSAPFIISEERRASKTSPTTDRLLTTSRKIFYGNPLRGRAVQDAYRGLPEHHASRIMSSERVLTQRSNLSTRRIVTRSINDELRSSGISVSRNNHVTESATRRSLGRNSVEKDSKATIAERLNKLSDSRRISARQLLSEKKSRFTERSAMSAGISVSGTNYRRISAERLALEINSRRRSERLASVKYSRISAERRTPERNPRRSSEYLVSVRESRISAERLTPEMNYRRSPERLASVRDSKISAERLTPERNTRRSPERLASVRDSRISAERLTPEMNYRRSPERLASVRYSRISAERLTPERNTRRSPEPLASVRDSRISAERLTPERNTRRSPERLASVRDSRISAERLTPERNTRRSPEPLASVRDSRISAERLTPERNTRRSPEPLATVRDSRISAERLTPEMNYRRSPERLASVRYSRISAQQLTPERNTRRSSERLAYVRDSRISAERLTSEINSRRSPERLAYVRDYRKISAERFISKRQSRRSTEVIASVGVLTRISPERMVSARDSKRYAEHLALVRNIRAVSVNRMTFGENSRRFVERSVSLRNSRKISTRVTAPDSRRFTMRMSLFSNSRETGVERTETWRKSRLSVERLASVRDSRKTSAERISNQRSSRSADPTVTVLGTRTSAERSVSERDSRRSGERLAPFTISKVYTERLAFDRRSVGRWAFVRDFRRSSAVPLAFELDARRSVERSATNRNSRTSAQLGSGTESRKSVNRSASLRKPRLSTDSLSSASNSRTSVEQMSFVRMVNERRSVFKQYSPDRLATKKLAAKASNRAVFSERRVSQPEQVSIIRFTLKAPERHNTNGMSSVRNTKLSYGHISKNQALYQSFGLSERRFSTMDNTTLKTESLLNIGLPLGTIQKSIINFRPAQYSSWTDKVTAYVRCVLATLTVIWPSLTLWKGSVLEYLTSLDVALGFSPKMDHFNSFFADKPTSNYALVPDDLALFGSNKPALAVMREKGGLLATVIGGGVSAAVMLLSTKPE